VNVWQGLIPDDRSHVRNSELSYIRTTLNGSVIG